MERFFSRIVALVLVSTLGFPFDSDQFASTTQFESNIQKIKSFHSKIVPPKEDKTFEQPEICSIDDNATLSRSRADFLDFFNAENNQHFISDTVFSFSDLFSDSSYTPTLLSSLLLNLPPPSLST